MMQSSTTPADILEYFRSAKSDIHRNGIQHLRPAHIERICKKAAELASDQHKRIVEEFGSTCYGDKADEQNLYLLKKYVYCISILSHSGSKLIIQS